MGKTAEEYRGLWWLADQPDHEVQGLLSIEPDGMTTLDLAGTLTSREANRHCRIVGETGINSLITLDDCYVRANRVFSVAPTQQWHVHEAVFGAHFSATEPWAFFDVRYSIPALTRLKALMQDVDPHAGEISGGKVSAFIREVVDTRNFFTHWDSSRQAPPKRRSQTVMLTSRMLALMEILLLRAIGFAPNSKAEREILRRRVSWL